MTDNTTVRAAFDTIRDALFPAETATDPVSLPTPAPVPPPADVYAGGTSYPGKVKVNLASFAVPVGATTIHVPVTLSKPSVNTVIAHVRCYNGTGGRAMPDTTKPVFFRPGETEASVAFKVNNMGEGATVKLTQAEVPDGADRGDGSATVTARTEATNNPRLGGRASLVIFDPLGDLSYSADARTILFNDKGGPNTWSTALSHGRVQVGNAETGYYGEVDRGGFERTDAGLVLKSFRMAEPVKVGTPAVSYPFLASMLSGHKTPETWIKRGSIEWVARMPNRRGSWPALWFIATTGWPPEIDVYEGFGYNGSWQFASDLSTNLHGGKNNQRTFTRPAAVQTMADHGLSNTLTTEFHAFACTIEADWITMFVDGVETMRYANPFADKTFYPLFNVAVKAKDGDAYTDGSGDMVVRSVKVWRA